MQRTAPSTPPRRQENYEGSPALMMASRIRAEQGPEKAAQYLSAMEPFLAPGERTHIAYTLGLPIPQPVQQNYAQQSQGMGGGFGGCTINLVKDSLYDNFIATAKEKFNAKYGHEPKVYEVVISDGSRRL